MKKLLFAVGVLMSSSVFAQDVMLDTMTFTVANVYPNTSVSICNKNKCKYYTQNVQDYLISITTMDGKSIKDQIKKETVIEASLINQEEKNLIKVIYQEKTQAGYFNDKQQLDPFLANKRTSLAANNEQIFYLPVTLDKKYNVQVDNNTNIALTLK